MDDHDTKTNWGDLVAAGRQALNAQSLTNWALGDLAREVEISYGASQLQQYADEIDVEYRTLLDYRLVAANWPSSERSEQVPWSVHQVLGAQPDRFQLIRNGMTVAEARTLVRARRLVDDGPEMTPPIEAGSWLQQAVDLWRPVFEEKVTELKLPDQVRVNIGFPLGKGNRGTDLIGQAWASKSTSDGIPQIFISPELSESIRVLDVLGHELIHVADDCKHRHGPVFQKAMKALNLEGKPTATVAGPFLTVRLQEMATELGPYPHAAVNPARPATGSPSQGPLKVICIDCKFVDSDGNGYTVRISNRWLQYGMPTCPCGKVMELAP